MKKLLISACFLVMANIAFAQEITLDKIYSGYYRGKGISGIASLKDGENYAVIEQGGIVKYSYKTTDKVGNIVDGRYQSYTFSMTNPKSFCRKTLNLSTDILS